MISKALDHEAVEAIQKAQNHLESIYNDHNDEDEDNNDGQSYSNTHINSITAGQWLEVAELFSLASTKCYESLRRRTSSSSPNILHTKWILAYIELRTGICLRLSRSNIYEATQKIQNALLIFPRYTSALYELALCQLDGYNYDGALFHFEQILSYDRKFPYLNRWLLIATSHARRKAISIRNHQSNDGKKEEEDDASKLANEPNHYAVLGVSLDFTPEELKRAYRSASLKYHPDKKTGSQDAFARIALAHSVLGNKEQREEFDIGKSIPASYATQEDIKTGLGPFLAEEVEDNYFPESKPFWPFGDPFEENPSLKARRSKLLNMATIEKAEKWHQKHPPPDLGNIPTIL